MGEVYTVNGTGNSKQTFIVDSRNPGQTFTSLSHGGQRGSTLTQYSNAHFPTALTWTVRMEMSSLATGTWNSLLSDSRSLAVYPNPDVGQGWSCSDPVLLMDSQNNSAAPLTYAQDACP